jgi:hypothetical protein
MVDLIHMISWQAGCHGVGGVFVYKQVGIRRVELDRGAARRIFFASLAKLRVVMLREGYHMQAL